MPDMFGAPDWRIFQLTDYEWYVGRTRDEAIAAALSDWGCKKIESAVEDGLIDLDDVTELGDESLDTLRFIDSDEDEKPVGEARTFREELARRVAAGLKEGELFACSEY